MVKTRDGNKHATIIKNCVKIALDSFFGNKSLVLRKVTESIDAFGNLSAAPTTTDTTFTGDLQFGLDLDQRYLDAGIVEVGDGVLYIHPDALSTLPVPQDLVIDGNDVWRILERIEAPDLGGTAVFFSYRCKREINSGDTT